MPGKAVKSLFYSFLAGTTIACSSATNADYFDSGLETRSRGKGTEAIECVERNMPASFAALQDSFKIKSKMPSIEYTIIDNFAAIYRPGIIVFDTVNVKRDNCKTIVDHELTHHNLNMIGKKLGYESWPIYSANNRSEFTLNDHAIKMLNEGISDYMDRSRIPGDTAMWWPSLHIADSLDSYKNINHIDYYKHGYTLVRPILDEFGSRAAWYMVWMPPKNFDIFYPEYWQRRVRTEIIKGTLGEWKDELKIP